MLDYCIVDATLRTFRDSSGQRGFSMINMADGSDVDVGFVSGVYDLFGVEPLDCNGWQVQLTA